MVSRKLRRDCADDGNAHWCQACACVCGRLRVSYQAYIVAQSAVATRGTQHPDNVHMSAGARHHEWRVSSGISCIHICTAARFQQSLYTRRIAYEQSLV
jgi:hypothetical protein